MECRLVPTQNTGGGEGGRADWVKWSNMECRSVPTQNIGGGGGGGGGRGADRVPNKKHSGLQDMLDYKRDVLTPKPKPVPLIFFFCVFPKPKPVPLIFFCVFPKPKPIPLIFFFCVFPKPKPVPLIFFCVFPS